MTFLHLSLIAGLAAIAVPIALHLFGQRQPELIDFPALRFVRETRQEQSTSWQLRHFLLLLLRILLLAALAFALARPRVHSTVIDSIVGVSAIGVCALLASIVAAAAFAGKRPLAVSGTCLAIALALWSLAAFWGGSALTSGPVVPRPDQSSPIATALILDNGPTMDYRYENQTRMELAKERAEWILDQLPLESKVGVLSGVPMRSLSLDPSTAKTQVNLIEPRGAHIDLLSRLRTAIDLVLESELERKEVYLITDMMQTSWSAAQPGLKELLAEHQDEILIQIMDVGVADQANWSLGNPTPNQTTVSVGGDIEIEVSVRRPAAATDSETSVTVDLLQEDIDNRLPVIRNGELQTPPTKTVDRQVVEFADRDEVNVRLVAKNLSEGTHHFTIQIDKRDPLSADNTRYVTIAARPQQPTLIVADNPELGTILSFIADPLQAKQANPQTLIERVNYVQLSQTDLAKYSVVWLHNPTPLSQASVLKLTEFVESGGNLLNILGPALGKVESLAGNPILDLLPGTLQGPSLGNGAGVRQAFMDIAATSHPMFQSLGEGVNDKPWSRFRVFANWTFDPLSPQSQTIMQFSDDRSPGVIVESRERGQIMTFTTPIPQPESRDEALWNDLWTADDTWAFVLLRGAIQSLYGASSEQLIFPVATPVALPNPREQWPSRYRLFEPDATSLGSVKNAEDDLLAIGTFEKSGIYRLRSLTGDPVVRGFCINTPSADTRLKRVDPETLDEQLGRGAFRVAKNQSEIESSVGQARFGRELYPLLMLFVAGLFLAEQAMSNRFYQIKFR